MEIETQPPPRLGLSADESAAAYFAGAKVRYWPLTDRPCRPHVGAVSGFGVEHGRNVLWVAGKSGYVLASHCEVV